MNQLHPIEAAWRRFRGSEHMELMRRSFAAVTSFLNLMGLKRLPPEIVLPGAVPYNLVPLRHGRSPFAPRNEVVAMADELIANTIHVWAAYRESKSIYRVERHLATCFSHTPWPDDAPAEALLLPSRCTILEVASDRGPTYFAGVYDLATAAEASGWLELRLSALAMEGRPLCDNSGAVVDKFNEVASINGCRSAYFV